MSLSPKISNYIIFSYIKEFVEDLCQVYENEELTAYNFFMKDANVLSDTEDFVKGFKACLDGTKEAVYCDGAAVNVPAFLGKCDENYEIIKDHISLISKIYKNPKACPEYGFFSQYSNEISEMKNTKNVEDPSDENALKKMLSSIKPDAEKAKKEFKEKNLNIERFIKIILLMVDEKIDSIEELNSDIEEKTAIKNIINIIANNSLSNLASKKLEIMQEILSIKSIKNIPINSLMGHISTVTSNDIL